MTCNFFQPLASPPVPSDRFFLQLWGFIPFLFVGHFKGGKRGKRVNADKKKSLLPNICMALVTNFINKKFGTSWFCHYCQNITHGVVTLGGHICIRLHLVDWVVARSAMKLGGWRACPHFREATCSDVQYPPLGVKSQYLLILAPPLGMDIEYLKYD